jgi:hypothetical protein
MTEKKEKKAKKVEVTGPTPGAGVDPAKVIRPNNRLKKRWRTSGTKLSLKAWARGSEMDDTHEWLYRKSAAYTAEARKERKSRVRVAQAASRVNKPAGGGKKGKGKGR